MKKNKNIDLRFVFHPAIWGIFLFLGIFEYVGLKYSLFENIWWYDVFLHGLGGFWLGTLIIKAQKTIKKDYPKTARNILFILAAVLALGLAWEAYEKLFDIFIGLPSGIGPFSVSLADTIEDLIMDVIGAGLSVVLLLRLRVYLRKN